MAALRLMLVEDNEADVLLTKEALRESGIEFVLRIAVDGEEAEKLLNEDGFRPDLIILDLNIPKFSGHVLLEDSKAAGVPAVVVFTGSENDQDRRLALAGGAKEFIVKPFGLKPYLDAVKGIVQRWGNPTQIS